MWNQVLSQSQSKEQCRRSSAWRWLLSSISADWESNHSYSWQKWGLSWKQLSVPSHRITHGTLFHVTVPMLSLHSAHHRALWRFIYLSSRKEIISCSPRQKLPKKSFPENLARRGEHSRNMNRDYRKGMETKLTLTHLNRVWRLITTPVSSLELSITHYCFSIFQIHIYLKTHC